jgi:hypothetical protein
MTVQSVANYLGLADSEVDANKDVNLEEIAENLGISDIEAARIAALGTPVSAPGAPTGVVATVVSPTQVSVAFTPPVNDGGATITGYAAAGSSNNGLGTGTESPIIIDHAFASGVSVIFQVVAINAVGTGTPGLAAAVTPNP